MRKNIKITACMLVMIAAMMGMTGCGKSTTVKSTSGENKNSEKESSYNQKKDKDDDVDFDDFDDDKDDNDDSDVDFDDFDDFDDNDDDENTSKWTEYQGSAYSLKLSSSWTKTSNSQAELAFIHSKKDNDEFAENITIMVQNVSGYNMDLEGYLDLSLQQFDSLGYDVIGYKHMTIDGVKGYYCMTSAKINSITCYFIQYFTILDEKAYVFTFTADEEGLDELEDEVEDIYNTIEFDSVSGM